MPNWCINLATFHATKEVIKRIREATLKDELFNEFLPMPYDLEETKARSGGPNWYAWRIAHWGVKWDVDSAEITDESETHITVRFATAWGPALKFYDYFLNSGQITSITALYIEGGCCFAGVYDDCGNLELCLSNYESYEDYHNRYEEADYVSSFTWLDQAIELFYA